MHEIISWDIPLSMVNWGLDDSLFLFEFFSRTEEFVFDQFILTVPYVCSILFKQFLRLLYVFIYLLYIFVSFISLWSFPIAISTISTIVCFRYIAFIANTCVAWSMWGMYLLGKNPTRSRDGAWNFPSTYRRRRDAPLWKLGRNWPEFNPGIQFTVVFVPRGVNPIVAHVCMADVFEI